MAMPSLQSDGGVAQQKSKSRKSLVVKPILKKLHVNSHSARTSLDLDRGWDDQPQSATSPDAEYGYNDYIAARDPDAFSSDRRHLFSPTSFHINAASPTTPGKSSSKAARDSRDMSFTISSTELGGGAGVLRRAHTYSATTHVRTTSGASASIPASGAGRIGSTFVHPFQQIPRTSTPPLSYANSDASIDTTLVSQQREHNSIDEGDEEQQHLQLQRHSLQMFGTAAELPPRPHHRSSLPYPPTRKMSAPLLSSPQVLSRRPSLTSSHRTSSQSDGNSSVRMPITRSNSVTPVLRPAHPVLNHSRSDLDQQDQQQQQPLEIITPMGACNNDPFFAATATNTATTTPATNTAATNTATTTPLTISCTKTVSPTVSHPSPMSPYRASIEVNSFRVRSRSDIDTHARQEQVREARRRFEAKEKEKAEKYAREEERKRERADAKQERQQAQRRKSSLGHASDGSNNTNNPNNSNMRNSAGIREKEPTGCLFACDDSRAEDVAFDIPSRSKSAKRRTTSLWTAFVLWLRTRLIKLGRRKAKSS